MHEWEARLEEEEEAVPLLYLKIKLLFPYNRCIML